MHILTLCFVAATILFLLVYRIFENSVIYSLFVTFLTFSYHFLMRLTVGFLNKFTPERFLDYRNFLFKPKKFERKIYKTLGVNKWKGFVPTYYPESFSLENHSLEEIALTMCGAEICHEVIIVFSFVPILFSIKFGVIAVFIATSFLAAAVDVIFVIVQRYNRPRIIRLIDRKINN